MSDDNQIDLETRYALQAQRTEIELTQISSKISEQVEVFKAHVEEDKVQDQRHIEILDKIATQVDNTQKCLDNLNSKVDLSTEKLQTEIIKINILDEQQNRMLDEHIAGVNTLKDMHLDQNKTNEKRFGELEKPGEWWRMTRKGILGLGALAAAVVAILKLLEVI